ncbi:hypothetical protein DVH24_009049 [Malus domestica]|uniref:Uncharacterized protein n=1 Tax=Malus domestica TaxID=3750 RepID=A0A498JN96_MALDO|nr:hypothetical protein DVH24_009049 [Malus domestica]
MRRKTNENDLKTLNFNDKDKINGRVNSNMIDFLVCGWVVASGRRSRRRSRVLRCFGMKQTMKKRVHAVQMQCHATNTIVVEACDFGGTNLSIPVSAARVLHRRTVYLPVLLFELFIEKLMKKNLKILNFNDKNKIKDKVNNIRFEFLV